MSKEELTRKIEAMEQKIQELENKVDQLEAEKMTAMEQKIEELEAEETGNEGFWENKSGTVKGDAEAHGASGAELELYMGAKQEVILGYAGELVGGDELGIVLGGAQRFHTPWVFDFIVGESTEGYLGHQTEFATARTKAQAAEQEITNLRNGVTGVVTKFDELKMDFGADVKKVAGLSSTISSLDNTVKGEQAKVTALETSCSTANWQAIASNTEALAESARAVATAVRTVGVSTKKLSAETVMNGVNSHLSAMDTQLASLQTFI